MAEFCLLKTRAVTIWEFIRAHHSVADQHQKIHRRFFTLISAVVNKPIDISSVGAQLQLARCFCTSILFLPRSNASRFRILNHF
jgi:hypothetical protein